MRVNTIRLQSSGTLYFDDFDDLTTNQLIFPREITAEKYNGISPEPCLDLATGTILYIVSHKYNSFRVFHKPILT